jgi:hypothetical protein
MDMIVISLLVIFAAFGAFCFNAGHNRAYRVVLKALIAGQVEFIDQKARWIEENRGRLSQADFTRCAISYQTVGQLLLGWYRYFAKVREDKELKEAKLRAKESLGAYLTVLERVAIERELELVI